MGKEESKKNCEGRLLFIGESFEEDAKNALMEICKINSEDDKEDGKQDFKREPIRIYIETGGGRIRPLLALVDVIKNSKTPVYTYALGEAFSAGMTLFAVGHKRFIGKHAFLMLHQLSAGSCDKLEQLHRDVEYFEALQRTIDDIIVTNTSITRAQLREVYAAQKDWYISADEAIELGIADELY